MKSSHFAPARIFIAVLLVGLLFLNLSWGAIHACAAEPVSEAESVELSDDQAEVLRLINEQREANGVSALTVQSDLTDAAQQRASELVQRMDADHIRPDGRNFYTVLDDLGIVYTRAAENIAHGQETPDEVVDYWMNSTGHRKNILNSEYHSIGIGVYTDDSGAIYWALDFID